MTNATPFIGSIVHYKDDFYVVVETKGGLCKIIAPHRGNGKLNVAQRNVAVTKFACKRMVCEHTGRKVLITPKGKLISLTSQRMLSPNTREGRDLIARAVLEP